jgi:hypothetical protein
MRSRVLAAGLLVGAPLLSGCVVATTSRTGGGAGFLFLLLPLLFVFLVMRMFRSASRRSGGSFRSFGPFGGIATFGTRRDPWQRSQQDDDQEWGEPQQRWGTQRQPNGPPPSEQMILAELDVLAHDVVRLEPQVALNEAARSDFEVASHRYRVARAAMSQPHDASILPRIQPMVDDARDAMARVRAILEGRSTDLRSR